MVKLPPVGGNVTGATLASETFTGAPIILTEPVTLAPLAPPPLLPVQAGPDGVSGNTVICTGTGVAVPLEQPLLSVAVKLIVKV